VVADKKIFIGPVLRRLRRSEGLTQVAMAQRLEVSPSYLNLLERNQRPVSARIMMALAEHFNFDAREISMIEPGGGVSAMKKRLSDSAFSEIVVDSAEIEDWLIAAPNAAQAFADLYDGQAERHNEKPLANDPIELVRNEIERWNNYFGDLDSAAETLADALRLQSGDLYAAIAEKLRTRHQLSVRILPETVMPDKLRRLDLHARQIQLSEMLDAASRTFQLAYLLGQLEFRSDVQALVQGAKFENRTAERLFQRHLFSYFAAALMMPYARFLRACEQTGYDLFILQRRFAAGFEHIAHRLTTLQRVGMRGLPFFMMRIDRAGQISKRFGGASKSALVQSEFACPLWDATSTFGRQGQLLVQLVQLENDTPWLTISRTVQGVAAGSGGISAIFAIIIGVAAEHARSLIYARGMELAERHATLIGPGCAACKRSDCPQRSRPPRGVSLEFDDRERGITPFDFEGEG
jgi:predicted transcriptional regulator/DNA-binding XRE family transcriptional regulator